MRGNGLMMPGFGQQEQPVVQVAAPMNDVQLVATLAGEIVSGRTDYTAADAVKLAKEIVIEAVRTSGELNRAIQGIRTG